MASELGFEFWRLGQGKRVPDGCGDGKGNPRRIAFHLLQQVRPRIELVALQHALFFAVTRQVQHPIRSLGRRLGDKAFALPILALNFFSGGRIEPVDLVGVPADADFNQPRVFDIDDVLDTLAFLILAFAKDALQRQGPAAVDVKEGLQFPIAGVGKEVMPGGHGFGPGRVEKLVAHRQLPVARAPGIAKDRILAVHGGVPEPFAKGIEIDMIRRGAAGAGVFVSKLGVHLGDAVELMLDAAQPVFSGLIGEVGLPAIAL